VSWDIFVREIPSDVKSLSDLPPDFVPAELPFSRAQIVSVIKEVVPFADVSNPAWVLIKSGERCVLDVNLGNSERLTGFAFHVHEGDLAHAVVSKILGRLGLRALDPCSDSGLFEADISAHSFER
jgi:hypothetical protein